MTAATEVQGQPLPLSERAERESQFFFRLQGEAPVLASTMAAWPDRTTVSDLIAALSERQLPLIRIGDAPLEPLPPEQRGGLFGHLHHLRGQ